MKIYIAMIADRHIDPEPRPFSTSEAAIDYARATAIDFARNGEADLDESETPKGWLYLAHYSPEGDSVWVIETDLDDSSPIG